MNNRIVMPQTLRAKCIEIAHSQHQGISKTIARLREEVWWPGISSDQNPSSNPVLRTNQLLHQKSNTNH